MALGLHHFYINVGVVNGFKTQIPNIELAQYSIDRLAELRQATQI